MEDFVNVLDFVTEEVRAHIMAGTLARDAQSGFTAAIATGKPVYVPTGPGWAYMLASTVAIPAKTTLFSDGALIVLGNGVNNHVFRINNSATAVVIRGLYINGNKANNTGGNGISMGGEGGGDITIRDMYIYDCSAHGIHLAGNLSSSLQVLNNRVHSCVAGGVTVNDTVTDFSLEGNHCWLNGTHGVGILGIGKNGAIVGNVCWDNGQINLGADNITGYNPANENLTITGNSCSGCENNGIHVGGSRITLTGNTSYNAGKHGIVMFAALPADGDDCIIADNVSYGSGLSGFWLKSCRSGVISGNIARNNDQQGFLMMDCSNLSITGNAARGNTQNGFLIQDCNNLSITGNTAYGNSDNGFAYSGTVADCTLSDNVANTNSENGFSVNACASGIVSGNLANANGKQGFYFSLSNDIAVTGNTARNQTQNGFLIAGGSRLTLTGNISHNNSLYGFTCSGTINDCVMGSNVAYSNDKSGFLITACNSGVVSGNISRDNVEHGFVTDNCTNIAITGNTARGNTMCGFINMVESAWLAISGNTARSNGADGLKLKNVTHSSITGNVMNSNTGYGINIGGEGEVEANNLISSNMVRSNTAGQIAQMALSTRILANDTGTGNTLTPAADFKLTLPSNGDYFYITGTTNITSISSAFLGRRITLQFAAALTMTDGGNLALAGNFTTTTADTISLIYDGANWVETSRSVN